MVKSLNKFNIEDIKLFIAEITHYLLIVEEALPDLLVDKGYGIVIFNEHIDVLYKIGEHDIKSLTISLVDVQKFKDLFNNIATYYYNLRKLTPIYAVTYLATNKVVIQIKFESMIDLFKTTPLYDTNDYKYIKVNK